MRLPQAPGPSDLERFTVLGEREEYSEIWLSKDESIEGHIPQKNIRVISAFSEGSSIFDGVKDLINGQILCLEGDLQHLTEWLRRTHRILHGMNLPLKAVRRLFLRCTILLRFGLPQKLQVDGSARRKSIRGFQFLVERSFMRPVYAPAALIGLLNSGEDVFGDERIGRMPRRIGSRFLDYDCEIWEPANGIPIRVNAGVFVPHPFVIDLLGSALMEPGSILQRDIEGRDILEPCTGAGILAITLARFGAKRVYCSDIDSESVHSACLNVVNNGLSEQVLVEQRFGLADVFADVVMVNPPWYGSIKQLREIKLSSAEKRCHVDEGHRLLLHLLDAARQSPHLNTFYLFMGGFDPLDYVQSRRGNKYIDVQKSGWRLSNRWGGAGNVRLYRLRRCELEWNEVPASA